MYRSLLQEEFSARCNIAENENVNEKRFKELRKPKTTKNEEINPFTITDNPNNLNVFPLIKQSFDNFQYSKTMSNIFQRKKLVKSMSQAPNLGRLLCRSKFESQHKNHEVKNCRKNCFSCPYLLKASFYQFKRVNKTFLLKNVFTCESSNLIYVLICQGCKDEYIGETGCLVEEQINIYRRRIRQRQYQVEEYLRTFGDVKIHMFPFLFFKKINH